MIEFSKGIPGFNPVGSSGPADNSTGKLLIPVSWENADYSHFQGCASPQNSLTLALGSVMPEQFRQVRQVHVSVAVQVPVAPRRAAGHAVMS